MEEQGAGRAINRHRFTLEEAEANLERPVVRALLQLMRFRNTHPAFNGQVPPCCCCDAQFLDVHIVLCQHLDPHSRVAAALSCIGMRFETAKVHAC